LILKRAARALTSVRLELNEVKLDSRDIPQQRKKKKRT